MAKTKKSIVTILVLSFLFSLLANTVFASNPTEHTRPSTSSNSVYLSSASKTAFAAEMDALYASTPDLCLFESTEEKIEYTAALKEQAAFAEGDEFDAIIEELKVLGVFLFEPEYSEGQSRSAYSTENADVTIDAPLIYYNSWESSWSVGCGGKWKNDDWRNDISNNQSNIGGPDGFGVSFYNVSGNYGTTAIIRQSASMNNGQSGNAHRSTGTSSRLTGNGREGFGFEIQDKVVDVDGISEPTYIGKQWYGECTYSNTFSSYDGVATAYYVHTWNNASIQSTTFSSGSEFPAVSFTITNSASSFIGYSTDKVF